MGRWDPGSRDRLEQAALDLYAERGFECTTVADIAERAGLTERTFFRYFAGKRDVLFAGAGALEELLVGAIAQVPASAPPIEAVAIAVEAAAVELQKRRDYARERWAVITANPELGERELGKRASLAAALAATLRERGVDPVVATLAAEAGMTAFRVAIALWVRDGEARSLVELVCDSFDQLAAVASPG